METDRGHLSPQGLKRRVCSPCSRNPHATDRAYQRSCALMLSRMLDYWRSSLYATSSQHSKLLHIRCYIHRPVALSRERREVLTQYLITSMARHGKIGRERLTYLLGACGIARCVKSTVSADPSGSRNGMTIGRSVREALASVDPANHDSPGRLRDFLQAAGCSSCIRHD